MTGKRVYITDTTLRDGHQSLIATRMKTDDMMDIAEQINEVGFYSVEVWGGATFDSCLRFLGEDPWDRLARLKRVFTKTKLQMLLRGQNLLGYHHYPDDIVEEFIKRAIANGIDIIRVFDALNDTRNLLKAVEVTRAEGGHIQCAFCYTTSIFHNLDYFVNLALEFENIGSHSICIKDMAGLLSPFDAYYLVEKIKAKVKIPVQIHSHYTSGMAAMTYLKAVEAGVDIIDTAFSPFALGPSQPPTESMVAALRNTSYDTKLDLLKLASISDYLHDIKNKYEIPSNVSSGVDTNVLNYQIPGGMITNLVSQLKEQGASDLLKDVLKEVELVREDLGYPPLVTPSSQIVGTQAVFNVLSGERYKMMSTEVKNYVKGLYGKPPGEIKGVLLHKVLNGENKISNRPADLLEPGLEKARKEIEQYIEKDEDILTYALFPNIALDFFKSRKENIKPTVVQGKSNVQEHYNIAVEPLGSLDNPIESSAKGFKITLDGESYSVIVDAYRSKDFSPNFIEGSKEHSIQKDKEKERIPECKETVIFSPMAGSITALKIIEGSEVTSGGPILILEVMKMENIINAPCSGKVSKIFIEKGASVNKGDPLVAICTH